MSDAIPFSDQAAICLICACENGENRMTAELLARAGASTATGVIAAMYIASEAERAEIIALAEAAIREQREVCLDRGLFMADRCLETATVRSNGAAA